MADTMSLYSLCLELGYQGRYGLGGSGQLQQLLRLALDKIERIRGAARLMPPLAPPEIPPARAGDPWAKTFLITTCLLAVLTVIAFGGFEFLLGSGVSQVQNTGLTSQ